MAFVTRGTHNASGSVWNFKNILLSYKPKWYNINRLFSGYVFRQWRKSRFENLFMSGKGSSCGLLVQALILKLMQFILRQIMSLLSRSPMLREAVLQE